VDYLHLQLLALGPQPFLGLAKLIVERVKVLEDRRLLTDDGRRVVAIELQGREDQARDAE
jgi:hypothetical protein